MQPQRGSARTMPEANRHESDEADRLGAAADEHTRLLAELGAETSSQRQAKRIVPWIVSLSLHGLLIAIGFIITWSVVNTGPDEEPVVVIADFDSLIFDPVATLEFEESAEQIVEPELELLPFDEPFEQPLPPLPSDVAPAMPESLTGAPPVDFAPAPAQGSASFMGLTTSNAQRIVYVIDASGGMIPYLPFIISELKKSLDRLSPEQSFAIVFYQGDEAVMVPTGGRGLTGATSDAKDHALRWIDENVRPRQVSNPIPAFETAIRLQPDAIFVLSANITMRGRYEVDQQELLDRLDQLNPVDRLEDRRKVQINCIQFLDPDPLDTMRLIAEEHGGERGYRFYSREELGL